MKHSEINTTAPIIKLRRFRILTRLWLKRKANKRYELIQARHRSMDMCRSMQRHGYLS